MIDFSKIKTYPIRNRKNKENLKSFTELSKGKEIADPELAEFAEKIISAHKNKKEVIVMIGGHVVKTGASLYLIDLMKRGIISHIAMNGSASIHDFEIALIGETSENVQEGIATGTFGMVEETGRLMNQAIKEGCEKGIGYACSVGKKISELNPEHKEYSLLYTAYNLKIPATAHIAIGTDTIHQHPSCDGAALGKSSYIDFKLFTDSISKAKEGVIINIGSAVILPEVFLKAITIARNLNYELCNITTANFDMIDHYRPRVNVVQRPTAALGGKGYLFIGKHEQLIPSLHSLILSKL